MISRANGDLETARRARDEILHLTTKIGIYHETTREAAAEAIEISIARGELDVAQQLLDRFQAVVTPHHYLAPHLARLAPKIAAARGDHDGIEEGFKHAVGMLRETESRFNLAVALVEYAEWLAGRDRAGEAEPLRTEAREVFERLGAKPWLERIDAPRSPVGFPGPS